MDKLKPLFLFLILTFMRLDAFAQEQKRLGVEVCYTEDTFACQFQAPKPLISSLNINTITFTFRNVDIVIDSNELRENSWGILFTSPAQGGGATGEFQCSPTNCANGAISILANNEDIRVVNEEGSNVNRLVGTVVFTLSQFKEGKLPSALQSIINSAQDGNLIVTATYLANEGSYNPQNPPANQPNPDLGTQFRSEPYFWGADKGTLLNAPTLSALARFNGLVINIVPPEDLSSVEQNAPNEDDGPALLLPSFDGNVSGYLLALWKAQEVDGTQSCSVGGVWNFVPNPFSYNNFFTGSPPPPPTLICPYIPYVEAIDNTGGVSNVLGCSFSIPATAVAPYLSTSSGAPALTPEMVAVPANFTSTEIKISILQDLINHPVTEVAVPGTCYSLVYIPVNQSSYGKMNIPNGEIYGFTSWALNSSSSEEDPTPNISLKHSNIGFMTGGEFNLASLDKDPSLTLKTNDCFIATAASGDVNSKSVFYWRILRDEYLTPIGFTKYYYRHAPQVSKWLNKHPDFKQPVNFVLENTGAAFYYSSLYSKKAFSWLKENTKDIRNTMSQWWEQAAAADELNPDLQRISYDLAITGGVFIPTDDKDLYNRYYSKSNVDLSVASNVIFWTAPIGWSLGLKGDYAFNTTKSDDVTLGNSTQLNERSLRFLSLEIIGGARFRSRKFLYLQPGVFAGVGLMRLREEGKPDGDDGLNGGSTKNETLGVTQYSPVFDFGANLDVSLSTLFFYSSRELAYEKDILLRLSAIYRVNPSKALDMSGIIINAGFAFLF